jgi:BON domain
MHDKTLHHYLLRSLALFPTIALVFALSGCRTAPPADDPSLLTALQTRISSDSALAREPIQASVQDGVATLSGSVSSDAARALAANDAGQVPGIRTVVNDLTVFTPSVQSAPPSPQPPVRQAPLNLPKPRLIPNPAAKDIAPRSAAPIPAPPAPTQVAPPAPTSASNAAPPPPAPIERPALPPAPPAPPPPPAFRTVTLTADTSIPVRVTQNLDSATTQEGDSFTGVVATDVIIDGLVALPQGTPVTGRVSAVQEAAHYKGNALLSVELTNINPRGEHIPVSTDTFTKEGAGRGKNTAEKVGGGAAVGAILGGILGGGKGAAIGAAAGGGVGAGANTVTRGQQVQIPSETLVQFRLTNSIAVRASTKDPASRDRDREPSADNQQHRPLDSSPSNPPPQ